MQRVARPPGHVAVRPHVAARLPFPARKDNTVDSRRSAFCTRYKREPARQTALVRVIDRLTSISFRLAAVLFVCATLMHVTGFHLAHPQAAHAGDYFYTANDSEMATIVNWHDETNATNVTPWPNWPEQASN